MIRLKSQENLGIIFAIIAYFCFSLLDVFQKYATINHSIFQIMLFKYFFLFGLSIFESKRKKNHFVWQSKNIKMQILRSCLSILESFFFILSFRYLPLADAHSIGSLAPIIVVLLSVIILKERVGLKTWIAVFVGFLGVLIILRPGLSIFDFKATIPLVAAFFLGLYQVVTRKVSENDKNETSIFFTAIIGIIIMSFLSFFYWQELGSKSVLIFSIIGILGSLGIYFQVIALEKARASIIQPFHYTLIFWAIIFGFVVYKDIPDIPTLIGAVIIVSSGIYIFRQRT